jgi:Ribonuclease G/E
MSRREIFLDRAPGELRGVVMLDDRPERLIIRRDEDDPRLIPGARLAARVAEIEPALGSAFLDLGAGLEAMISFKPDARPVRGQTVEVEVRSAPRRGKLATVRILGDGEGDPRLLAPAPELAEALNALVPRAELVQGREARAAADEAEAEALTVVHPLPGGGTIAIEPTRALTAIDVDLGQRKGGDAKRVTRQANLAAIGAAARLLRLKGLGGLIVIDLAGRGHDGQALMTAARTAFGPDNPGVAIGPVTRFGTLELTLPRRGQPVAEVLCDEDGRLGVRTLAQRLVRRLQDEARAQPGARLLVRCAPEVEAAARPLAAALAQEIGARFSIDPDPARARESLDIST